MLKETQQAKVMPLISPMHIIATISGRKVGMVSHIDVFPSTGTSVPPSTYVDLEHRLRSFSSVDYSSFKKFVIVVSQINLYEYPR